MEFCVLCGHQERKCSLSKVVGDNVVACGCYGDDGKEKKENTVENNKDNNGKQGD